MSSVLIQTKTRVLALIIHPGKCQTGEEPLLPIGLVVLSHGTLALGCSVLATFASMPTTPGHPSKLSNKGILQGDPCSDQASCVMWATQGHGGL